MRKYVFVLNAIGLLEQLMNGKRVEGVLYLDQNTGKLTFKAYNRQPRVRHRDTLVKKDYGTAQVMGMLEEHNRDAMEALKPHPQPLPLGRGEITLQTYFCE